MNWTFSDVLDAFKEYIAESEYIDVCHTKFGYVILHYNPGTGDFAYTPETIESPEELLQCLKEEIVMDVQFLINYLLFSCELNIIAIGRLATSYRCG